MRTVQLAGLVLLGVSILLRAAFFMPYPALLGMALSALALVCLRRGAHTSTPDLRLLGAMLTGSGVGLTAIWTADRASAMLNAPVALAVIFAPLVIFRCGQEPEVGIIRRGTVLAGVAAVIIGCLAWAFGIDIRGMREVGRFSILFEYSNSLGAFLGVASAFAWGLADTDGRSQRKSLWLVPLGVLGAGLGATLSRLGIGVTVFFGCLNAYREVKSGRTAASVIGWSFGLVIGMLLHSALSGGLVVESVALIAASAVVGPLAIYLADRIGRVRLWFLGAASAVFAVASLLVLARRTGTYELLLSRVLTAANDVRSVLYQDGVRMFVERPFGWGAGAFQYASLAYRSLPYFARFTHSVVVEMAVEGGILSLAGIVIVGYAIYRNVVMSLDHRREANDRTWVGTLPLAVLFTHSLGDFNLSLPALSLLFWFMYAMMPQAKSPSQSSSTAKKLDLAIRALITIALVFSVVVNGLNACAHVIAVQAADTISKTGASDEALRKFELASILAPYNSDYRIDLAQVAMATAEAARNSQRASWAADHARKATHDSPFNPRVRTIYALQLAKLNKVDQAIDQMRMVIKNDPFGPNGYEILGRICADAVVASLHRDNREATLAYARKAFDIPSEMRSIREKSRAETVRRGLLRVEPLESDGIRLSAAIGAIYSAKYPEALELLSRVKSPQLQTDVNVWSAVAHSFSGDTKSAEAIVKAMPPQLSGLVLQVISLGRP